MVLHGAHCSLASHTGTGPQAHRHTRQNLVPHGPPTTGQQVPGRGEGRSAIRSSQALPSALPSPQHLAGTSCQRLPPIAPQAPSDHVVAAGWVQEGVPLGPPPGTPVGPGGHERSGETPPAVGLLLAPSKVKRGVDVDGAEGGGSQIFPRGES